MPNSYENWFKSTFPADTNALGRGSPIATQAPPPVATAPPRFISPFIYRDIWGNPMHPEEFMANKRLWGGTTWEDPFGQVNPFDAEGNLTEEAIAMGYTPDIVWPGPGYRGTNTYQF